MSTDTKLERIDVQEFIQRCVAELKEAIGEPTDPGDSDAAAESLEEQLEHVRGVLASSKSAGKGLDTSSLQQQEKHLAEQLEQLRGKKEKRRSEARQRIESAAWGKQYLSELESETRSWSQFGGLEHDEFYEEFVSSLDSTIKALGSADFSAATVIESEHDFWSRDVAGEYMDVVPIGNDEGKLVGCDLKRRWHRNGDRSWLSEDNLAELRFSAAGARYSEAIVPAELRWAVSSANASKPETPHDASPIAIRSTGSLLLTEGEKPRFDDHSHNPRCLELWELVDRAFAGLASKSEPLCIDEAHDENPAVAWLCRQLRELTSAEPIYPLTPKPLDSRATYERVKAHWDAFVNAPWSSAVDHSLAKFKYLLESGDRPRFWCEAHHNHYGFRLRTRDHTWITGYAYINTKHEPNESDNEITNVWFPDEQNNSQPSSARVGAMRLKLYELRDRKDNYGRRY